MNCRTPEQEAAGYPIEKHYLLLIRNGQGLNFPVGYWIFKEPAEHGVATVISVTR
jgi:hypothetical protein